MVRSRSRIRDGGGTALGPAGLFRPATSPGPDATVPVIDHCRRAKAAPTLELGIDIGHRCGSDFSVPCSPSSATPQPDTPTSGRRTHRGEVAPYFTTMWPHFVPGKSKVVLERVIVDGGDVMLLGVFTHTVASTGKEFTTPSAMHLVVEDGEIVRMHLYEDTLSVDQAFNTD
ncbi:nuclear transport factor 2 family protein [Streptomyces mirabilis]|uniref:nuclear transport factor 2 family protein n=1 Tax=Streptomyces mirabilis TaxID=68239 RepID=UPI0033BAD996